MTKPEELIKLEDYCRQVYEETNKLFEKYAGLTQIRGCWCLCGPPLIEPDLFFLSYQGGGADGLRHRSWPAQQFYYNSEYPLGRKLTRMFAERNLTDVFRASTGTARIFFQCPSQEQWMMLPYRTRIELEDFSIKHALAFIEKMRPKLIVAIGSETFNSFVPSVEEELSPCGRRIMKKGRLFGIPVLGVAHLTGYRLRTEELEAFMEQVESSIRGVGPKVVRIRKGARTSIEPAFPPA